MTARNPVGWFELYVHDMERAKAFYEKAGGIAYAIEAVGRQPRKHVGLPDEP